MSDVEYDFDVPIPTKNGFQRGGRSDALRNLPKGGSKFFPDTSIDVLYSAFFMIKKNDQIKFKVTMRTVTENGVKGVRVWRLD